jgi:hypothetical protein
MTMKIKMSKRFRDIEKRIDRIPAFTDNLFHAITKQQVVDFIKDFQRNIEGNNLDIMALSMMTIMQKESKGYTKASTPLYGAGKTEKNSYVNMFFIQKLKNGWKAQPRWAKHHTAELELRKLLDIHEHGATIVRKDGVMIRIPPRPVAFLTYRNILNKTKKSDRSQKVKRAINQYIQTGTDELLKKIFANEKIIGKEFMSQ